MSKFICQKEMICSHCSAEIPKGSWVIEDMWEDIICQDCEGGETNLEKEDDTELIYK